MRLTQVKASEFFFSTEMDVMRTSARKSRMERIKNEQIREIMGVKGKPDIIDTHH